MQGIRDQPPMEDSAEAFGTRADFWERYDKLADKHDKDMLQRMHSNLDVLLIFVSDDSRPSRPKSQSIILGGSIRLSRRNLPRLGHTRHNLRSPVLCVLS